MDKNKLIELLEAKLQEVSDLSKSYDINRIEQWKNEVLMILDNLLTPDSKYYKQIENLDFYPSSFIMGEDNSEANMEAYERDINSAKSTINAIIFGVKNNLLT